ncbi:hypothetical protein HMPREF9166_1964 [Selenomonas sp. oral taxon 149 str. 67H29BP]|nr:hypothetical protein HMPREF9166_1964 [Selenomonas sp. oral taxon 149 str. 67H29BP]
MRNAAVIADGDDTPQQPFVGQAYNCLRREICTADAVCLFCCRTYMIFL